MSPTPPQAPGPPIAPTVPPASGAEQKPLTERIGQSTYTFYLLDAWTALDVGADLIELLGPSLAGVVAGKSIDQVLNLDTDNIDAGQLLQNAIDRMDKDKYFAIMKILETTVHRDNLPIEIGATFAGNLAELMKVMYTAVRFNFKDFFLAAKQASIKESKEAKTSDT